MEAALSQLKMNNDVNTFSGSISVDASSDNANHLETSTNSISRNLFSEMPQENGSAMNSDLEYLVSSSEENKEISHKNIFDYPPLTPNRNGDVLFESTGDDRTETFTIASHPGESLGLVLGMNEIIDASEGEVRKVYVKKISTNGATNRVMNESNRIRLGDEILAINGTYIKNLSRTECLNLLIDLPNEITLLLQHNKLSWTTGPRCSFYLNLVDKNPESILSPAPKLFTNEGKKIPDGYKLLEVSLYRETSDLLGIIIVPSYGDTRHYYQIKQLEPDGICSKSKLLNKGDCLVSCNGNSLHKIPFNQCLNILKSEGPSLTFEVFRKDDNQAVLESHDPQPIYDDSCEVNNNNNNNNNNNDDDDGRSTNNFTSELLISTEIKPNESIRPILETNHQENLLDLTDLSSSDSKTTLDISDPPNISKSHLSSFECDIKNPLSKPVLDFLTGSPFTESADNVYLDGLQKPIDACPADSSLLSVIDEPCIQLTAEAVQSSPHTDWSSQLNMSEQSPAKETVSLDGLEFSNAVINNANELNNNFNTGDLCSSNEDLISIDTDVLSPINSNPFSNHADPWEAAGEAKSENLLPDFQMSQSANQKNVLNEFIDTVESPDYVLDPLDGLQENILQATKDEKCLSSQPTSFGTHVSKGLNLESSANVNLDNDLAEEERTSPVSYDDSLSGSIGIHTADEEGDIPLSSRNSDNELIEDMPALSPDSGRADSPGVYKNNSYDQEKFSQKEIISKLAPTKIDNDYKLTDEENTVYHTISDISKENKTSEKFGSFDSNDSCATSVGSFESCAETGEQDPFGTNSKPFVNKIGEAPQSHTKSLPRNAFSNFKEFQTSMLKPSKEKYSTLRTDGKLFPFNEISSSLKSDHSYGKSDYLNTFSANLFSRNYRQERKSNQVRSEDKPFQVEVLKGIIGLGMTLKVDDQGFVKVTHIQNNSPIGRNGIIKVGDYILSINNTDIVGVSDSRVQQILRLLPRGLIKVVASAVPISDWKSFTEDAEKPSVGSSGTSLVAVSLTTPIKMSDSFSLNLSGRGFNSKTALEKKPSLSFSSALDVFSKDQSTDSVKQSPPPTVPSIPTSVHKDQYENTETCVKSIGFSNNQSPQLDKMQGKHNSSSEDLPQSSPESVLSQVRMFENYFQKNSSTQELKEPLVPSKQKFVETFEPMNQKPLPEKDSKEAVPDILQNGTAKTITNSHDDVNKMTQSDNSDCNEDVIVLMKNTKYKTFSALPRSSAPRLLDSFSIWDSMDSIVTENQNNDSQLKKIVNQVSSAPKDAVKEEVIIPTKKTSVQSLVNRFNYPQDSRKSNSSKICNGSIVSKGMKVNSENAIDQLPKPSILEETIEPMRKACITNMSKPLPISFSDMYDIDEVLLIEKTEKKDSKPDLKMTLTGPYSAIVEVSEPVLKPEKKTEDKFMKKPVAPLRKSYILNSSRIPEDNNTISEVKDTKPEVCIGIARRLSQSAVPDCIDIMKIPEVVPTETAFHPMEENIVPQVKDNKFATLMETPSVKRAKAIALLGGMDYDKYSLAPLKKLESKEFVSERTEVNEDQIVSHVKCSVAMSAKPRKTDNLEGEILPLVRKSKTLEARKPAECQESNSSSHEDLNYQLSGEALPKCSLNVAEKKAEVIVNDIINEAKKEISKTNVLNVNNPSMVICDITGHTPCNEEKDLSTITSMETASKSDTLEDNLIQIDEPESCSEIKPQGLPIQKRNLPLIENGKPKPLPRQSRQLSPTHEIEEKSREKPKIIHRSLPSPSLKPEIQPSALETNIESRSLTGLISPVPFQRSVSSSDAPLKITSYPEVSSVASQVCQQKTNVVEEKEKAPISPIPATKTASLLVNRVDKVEMPTSPVSLQPSSTSLIGNGQTENEVPPIVKSSLTLSSPAKTLPLEEDKSLLDSVSSPKKEPPHICQDGLEALSSMSNVYEDKKMENHLSSSVDKLPEVKSETTIPSSTQRAVFSSKDVFSSSKIIEAEKPASPVTNPIDTFFSSPLLPEVGEKSPLLASPLSPSKHVTENLASSPSASQPTNYLETMHNDSAQTSPTCLSPRRFGFTNRKLPDIFQDSQTLKSLSSPTKNKTFLEESAPSESVPIEKNVLEHKVEKVREFPNLEVSPSQTVRAEPKITSDPTFKMHSIEIVENVPKAEVAVSQCINIEPTKASALLSEVKAEKQSVQVMEEASKPEVAVSQFIGIRPTTAADLPEKKVKTHHTAVVEEIAKPEVAVSQFIGIKPTTASDLTKVKELKESKVEISKPEKVTSSVKEQEQKVEVLAGIPAPKSEVAVSKFIGLQPTTATKLSEPVKSPPPTNASKEPERQSPCSKAKLTSTTQPDIVTSAEMGRPALLRYKSSDATLQHVLPTLRNSRNEDSLPTMRRRMEKTRPRSEIFSKEIPGIFSKRKWCISTKSGQTNFAIPSEPDTVDRVVQLGLIDEDDLSRLLTSANLALDKMSFSNNHEIHIAILEKDATEKIGIKLKKGEKQELVISLLEPDGAAIKQKFILIGDCLLLVNGKPAWNQTVMDTKVWLQTIETRIILVLGRYPLDGEENDCEYLDIIFNKSVTGMGFCLEGGVGCLLGDRPISVKRIFKGGPAEKGGQLMVGDEILKVNDMDFRKQRHFVAWNHLKFLPAGEVKMHICRRKSQNPGMKAVQLEASSNDSVADTSA